MQKTVRRMPRQSDSAWKMYLIREWSHAVPEASPLDGTSDQDSPWQSEMQQQRPWTTASLQRRRTTLSSMPTHGCLIETTPRENHPCSAVGSKPVVQTHDQLLELLELRKKNVRADCDGVVLLTDSSLESKESRKSFHRLGSARYGFQDTHALSGTCTVDKLPAAAGAQSCGWTKLDTPLPTRAASLEGSLGNGIRSRARAPTSARIESSRPATSAIRGNRLHLSDSQDIMPSSAVDMPNNKTLKVPAHLKRAASGITRGGVVWTRVASSDSKASPENPHQTSCPPHQAGIGRAGSNVHRAGIERAGSGVWSRVSSTPWSWELPREGAQAGLIEACYEEDAGASSRQSRHDDSDTGEGRGIQASTDVSNMPSVVSEDTEQHRAAMNEDELILADIATKWDTEHNRRVDTAVEEAAHTSKVASPSPYAVKQGGGHDLSVRWQREGRTGENVFERYANKGKINAAFSCLKRQIIIIDDRKPLTQDMLGVSGNLALPVKKMPSAFAVRERERLLRDLNDLSNRFIRDRINGGPRTRRAAALGAKSHSLAHLKQQLQGVHEAVCPTCAIEVDPQLQDSFSVQTLLERQESWEDDGCFGDAPSLVCSHNHEHTAHDILSEAAARNRRRRRDDDRNTRNSLSSGQQNLQRLRSGQQNLQTRDIHAREEGKRPESLSAWSTGDDDGHALLDLQDADGQRLSDRGKPAQELCSSTYKAQLGMRTEVVEVGEGRQNGRGGGRVSGDEGQAKGAALTPHPPQTQVPKGGSSAKPFVRKFDGARLEAERNLEAEQQHEVEFHGARRRSYGKTGEDNQSSSQATTSSLTPKLASNGTQKARGGHTGLADKVKAEVCAQADELLRQKLMQLEEYEMQEPGHAEAQEQEEGVKEFPFDPDAEIVRHFGRELRLSSMGAISAFIVGEIEKRHGKTYPTAADLLQLPEKWQWVRMWVRAEGCGSALKFILQYDIGGSRSTGIVGSTQATKRAMKADGTSCTGDESESGGTGKADGNTNSLQSVAKQKDTGKAVAKLMLLNPLESFDKQVAEGWV